MVSRSWETERLVRRSRLCLETSINRVKNLGNRTVSTQISFVFRDIDSSCQEPGKQNGDTQISFVFRDIDSSCQEPGKQNGDMQISFVFRDID
jgi:hypothetical protein